MATWTAEQTATSDGNNSVLAFPGNVKSGSLLIACANVGTAPSTPTDTRSNTWTLIRSTTTANDQTVAWWYAISNGAGACTVTFADSSFDAFIIAEYSVDSGTITLDVEGTQYNSGVASGTDTATSAAITATANTSLALSFIGTDNGTNPDAIPAGTGWTQDAVTDTVTGLDQAGLEYKTVNAGSVTATWSPTQTTSGQCHSAVFKAASAGTTVSAPAAGATTSVAAPPKPRPTAPFSEINVRM